MKNVLATAILTGCMGALVLGPVRAQPGSGGPAPGADPTTTPIDGGSALLLAGGIGYALKRLRALPKRGKE